MSDTDKTELKEPEKLEQEGIKPDTESTEPTEDPGTIKLKQEEADLNKQVQDEIEQAGFDYDAIVKEVTDKGEITPELVTKLKEKINPEFIDAHLGRIKAEIELSKIAAAKEIEEQNRKVAEMNSYIYEQVGGEENFKRIAGYLNENLPKEEIDTLNSLLSSGDRSQVNIAMKAAVDKYNAFKGKGALMQGDTSNTSTGFQRLEKDECFYIMTTEKYKTDRAYAKEIDARRLKTKKMDEDTFLPGQYWKGTRGNFRAI